MNDKKPDQRLNTTFPKKIYKEYFEPSIGSIKWFFAMTPFLAKFSDVYEFLHHLTKCLMNPIICVLDHLSRIINIRFTENEKLSISLAIFFLPLFIMTLAKAYQLQSVSGLEWMKKTSFLPYLMSTLSIIGAICLIYFATVLTGNLDTIGTTAVTLEFVPTLITSSGTVLLIFIITPFIALSAKALLSHHKNGSPSTYDTLRMVLAFIICNILIQGTQGNYFLDLSYFIQACFIIIVPGGSYLITLCLIRKRSPLDIMRELGKLDEMRELNTFKAQALVGMIAILMLCGFFLASHLIRDGIYFFGGEELNSVASSNFILEMTQYFKHFSISLSLSILIFGLSLLASIAYYDKILKSAAVASLAVFGFSLYVFIVEPEELKYPKKIEALCVWVCDSTEET